MLPLDGFLSICTAFGDHPLRRTVAAITATVQPTEGMLFSTVGKELGRYIQTEAIHALSNTESHDYCMSR